MAASLRWKLGVAVFLGLLLLFVAAICFGIYAFHFSVTISSESYAQWGVALMINDHMRDNNGAWPRSWDDLLPYRDMALGSCTFEELPSRIGIDFCADPNVLAKAPEPIDSNPPFRVVWLKNGRKVHYQDQEPNQMIWDYLIRSSARP